MNFTNKTRYYVKFLLNLIKAQAVRDRNLLSETKPKIIYYAINWTVFKKKCEIVFDILEKKSLLLWFS